MKESDYPHITVAAIIEHDGRFLLVEERSEGRIVFNQPAGHLELNESIIDAVKRETMEETGYPFSPEAISGIYLLKAANGITYMRICFCGDIDLSQAQSELDPEIIGIKWLTRDEIIEKGAHIRSQMVLKGIDDYLDGNRYPIAMIHHLPPETPFQ